MDEFNNAVAKLSSTKWNALYTALSQYVENTREMVEDYGEDEQELDAAEELLSVMDAQLAGLVNEQL